MYYLFHSTHAFHISLTRCREEQMYYIILAFHLSLTCTAENSSTASTVL
jgi:hypothetical protein